jgi:hypothetical protein
MGKDNWYDTAQICLNGHLINPWAVSSPERNQNFCGECGIKTITDCPHCKEAIRGRYHSRVFTLTAFYPPKFCYHCGQPYPWTEAAIEAAKEYSSPK